MKFNPDTYLLYGVGKPPRPAYPIRLRLKMKAAINYDALNQAAQRGIKRYPYYAVKVVLGGEGNYDLQSNSNPITVLPTRKKLPAFGSDEVNKHLVFIDYDGDEVFFNIHHTLTGATAALEWAKTTLYEYVRIAFKTELPTEGIRTADSPLLNGETDYPREDSLIEAEPYWKGKSVQTYYRKSDYLIAALNPFNKGERYYAIDIDKDSLMKYARQTGGSPTSVLTVLMLRSMFRALPEKIETITAGVIHNFSKEIGCENSYRDMVRILYIPFRREQLSMPDDELNKLAREAIAEQTKQEHEQAEMRYIIDSYNITDTMPSLQEKCAYNMMHNRYMNCPRSTYSISYFGKNTTLGALEDYVSSVYCISEGSLFLEVIPMADKFCISFYLVRALRRFINSFFQSLLEAGLKHTIEGPILKNLPTIDLPKE